MCMKSLPKRIVIGIPSKLPLETVASAMTEVLHRPLSPHDSSYYGGAYFRAGLPGEEEMYLFCNLDALDGSPFYGTTNEYPLVLRVDRSIRDARTLSREISRILGVSATILEHS